MEHAKQSPAKAKPRTRRKTGKKPRLESRKKEAKERSAPNGSFDIKSLNAKYFAAPAPRVIVSVKDKVRLGRVSRLEIMSPEEYSSYLEQIRQGAFPATSIGVFGVPVKTFEEWITRGYRNVESNEAGDEPLNIYGQLLLDTREARSSARLHAELCELRGKSTGRFLMEGPGRQTREQEGYASGKQQVEVTGRDGGPVEIEPTITREDKRSAVAGALLELAKVPGLLETLMQQPRVVSG